MKKRTVLFLFLFTVFSAVLLANRTAVAIAGPVSVAAGTEVTITIQVTHSANTESHYTNWVTVKADGKEIARWDFSPSARPESADFSREVKYAVSKSVEITAQGNCIRHGSRGPAVLKIEVK